ncbi:hypothetical protein ACFWFX_34395, partial [Streptomyces roseolus]|uniref:hypothetical protein n=1 Tax=Streptomyces roseolus TaxID=67358 RepID=UPI00365810D4
RECLPCMRRRPSPTAQPPKAGGGGCASLTRAATAAEHCASTCALTATTLLRQSGHDDRTALITLLQSCTSACLRCERECREHEVMHAHCRLCVRATTACADACERLLELL